MDIQINNLPKSEVELTIDIEPKEALGVNTSEQLEAIKKIL